MHDSHVLERKKNSTTFVVLEGTSALAAECLGAKCQANNHAGKETKSSCAANAGTRLKAISFTTVAHLCSLPHSFSPANVTLGQKRWVFDRTS